ncbi:MAG TPA: hypothetical protein VND94_00660 [Terriglobia bacterium]|nr:hypothetical protein [Terriglobia bacterium]
MTDNLLRTISDNLAICLRTGNKCETLVLAADELQRVHDLLTGAELKKLYEQVDELRAKAHEDWTAGKDTLPWSRDAFSTVLGLINTMLAGREDAEPEFRCAPEVREREHFKNRYRHLDLSEVSDAWGRTIFKHSHVQAIFDGWLARASLSQPIAAVGNEPVLPYDIAINQIRFNAGVKLSTFIEAARRWHTYAMKAYAMKRNRR